MDTKTLARKLTPALMAERLGVSEKTIANHVSMNGFPAAWYGELKALAREKRVACPMELFAWKRSGGPLDGLFSDLESSS